MDDIQKLKDMILELVSRPDWNEDTEWICLFCGEVLGVDYWWVHKYHAPDCIVREALALIGMSEDEINRDIDETEAG